MSDEIQKTALRLPKGLHEAIHAAAKESGRTMNAEIVYRLQQSFEGVIASLQLEVEPSEREKNYDKFKEIIVDQAKIIQRYSELVEKSSENMATMIDFIERQAK